MSKKVKVKEEVTHEMIAKKVNELCDLIGKTDHKSEAANFACFEIVTAAAYCHYHGLGILEETLLEWREASLRWGNEGGNEDTENDETTASQTKH